MHSCKDIMQIWQEQRNSVLFELSFRSMKGKSVFFSTVFNLLKLLPFTFCRGMPQCSVAVNFQPEVMTSIPNYIYIYISLTKSKSMNKNLYINKYWFTKWTLSIVIHAACKLKCFPHKAGMFIVIWVALSKTFWTIKCSVTTGWIQFKVLTTLPMMISSFTS